MGASVYLWLVVIASFFAFGVLHFWLQGHRADRKRASEKKVVEQIDRYMSGVASVFDKSPHQMIFDLKVWQITLEQDGARHTYLGEYDSWRRISPSTAKLGAVRDEPLVRALNIISFRKYSDEIQRDVDQAQSEL